MLYALRHEAIFFSWTFFSHCLDLICRRACLNCYLTLFRLPGILLIPTRPLALASYNKAQSFTLTLALWGAQHHNVCWFSQKHLQASKTSKVMTY